jgi:hypothetical protein
MKETRTVKITVVITPSLADRLNAFAERAHWSKSTAIAVLIDQALISAEGERND